MRAWWLALLCGAVAATGAGAEGQSQACVGDTCPAKPLDVALFKAAFIGDAKKVKKHLKLGANPNWAFTGKINSVLDARLPSPKGSKLTPMHAAAWSGSKKALRRLLKSKGEPLKKWSQYAGEATEIVNTRPNATLSIDKKWRSPMEVFRASMEGDTELRDKIRESIIAAANRRRAPGNVTAFEPGTPVRVAKAEYLKESLHSNESKMSPKWSKAVFRVRSVQRSKHKNMIPAYTLESADNTAETKLLLKVPEGEKARWHSHDTLQRVYGTPVEAPVQPDRAPDTDARPFLKNPSVAAPLTGPAATVKAKSKRKKKQTQFYGGAYSDRVDHVDHVDYELRGYFPTALMDIYGTE